MRFLNENVLSTISGGATEDIQQAMLQLIAGAQGAGLSPNEFAQSAGYDNIGAFVDYVKSLPPR